MQLGSKDRAAGIAVVLTYLDNDSNMETMFWLEAMHKIINKRNNSLIPFQSTKF